MSALTLHEWSLDEQCYKVRLLISTLGITCTHVEVDAYPGFEHRTRRYLRLNPRGSLPILTDGDVVLSGAEPILAYLARRYDATGAWLPDEAGPFGAVTQWLAFASGELREASRARWNSLIEGKGDGPAMTRAARDAFRIMDDHMTLREFDGGRWFAGDAATIADIALFPAIALSRDIGIDHDEFPALRRWMRRVRALPGFITMPGIPAFH